MFDMRFLQAFFLVFLATLFSRQAKAENLILPPPVWECIQTIGNDVVLNWEVVPDPGNNFIQYEVHSVEDGLIAVIPNINVTSYTHVGITVVKNYFIVVVDNISGATNSTTLQNLRLTFSNPGNGLAILNWNNTGYPLPAPPSKPIQINREFPVGVWTIQDSVIRTATQYKDTIDICSAFLSYQISFPGNTCDFISNTIGDIFEDKITPNMPVVSNVSIDSLTGLVNLNWNVNQQPDTYGYIVYLKDAAGNVVEIDTVWGLNNTTYAYLENTTTGPLTYSIAAFDSCFTTTIPPTYQTSAKADVHTTIFLDGHFEPCGSVAVLDWTPYEGWDQVDHYEVYLNGPLGGWNNVVSLNAYQHSELVLTTGVYQFLIKAVHLDGRISFSNKIILNVTSKAPPSINYILSASVIDQHVFIRHLVDTAGNVASIAFERMRKDGTFYEIGRQDVFLPITTIWDENANVEEVNIYRAIIIDSCGLQTTISDTVHTTVLDVIGDSITFINSVSWTPYIGYDGLVQRYDLYRIIDGIVSPSAIATLGPNTYTFQDNVEMEFVRSKLCYYVVAVENTNSYGFAEQANSNLKCSEFTPSVYIPNSFTPGGLNPIFKPQYSYMKLPKFQMRIFNRWGEEIYQSEDPLEGWNGKLSDHYTDAPDGNYIYTIRFYGIDDKEMVFNGHLNLLR